MLAGRCGRCGGRPAGRGRFGGVGNGGVDGDLVFVPVIHGLDVESGQEPFLLPFPGHALRAQCPFTACSFPGAFLMRMSAFDGEVTGRLPPQPATAAWPGGPRHRAGGPRTVAISRVSTFCPGSRICRSASTGTARAASPTSNAAPLNARTAATALSSPAPSPVSSASTTRTSPRRSAPGSPATDGNSNPNRYAPPPAIAPRTDSGSCTNPRHRPTSARSPARGGRRRGAFTAAHAAPGNAPCSFGKRTFTTGNIGLRDRIYLSRPILRELASSTFLKGYIRAGSAGCLDNAAGK